GAGVVTVAYERANPVYSATTRFLVVSEDSTSSAYQGNLLTQERANDIAEILSSNKTVMYYVVSSAAPEEGGDAGLKVENLSTYLRMLSVSGDSGSIIRVSVRGANPAVVKELILALEMYLPQYISEEIFSKEHTRLEVVDKAFLTPDAAPQKAGSNMMRNTMISAVLGLVVSCIVVWICNQYKQTVYRAADLKRAFSDIPLLGSIPTTGDSKAVRKAELTGGKRDYTDKVLSDKTAFSVVEAYRGLRTNLSYFLPKHGTGVVYGITSEQKAEGKSLTIANLAICFAQLKNKKILLLEADMRMPTDGRIFGYKAERGLTDVLAGLESDYHNCLVGPEGIPNLQILPVGQLPPNPTELLASEQMSKLIDLLREEYDYILVDLPPIGLVSDAGVLANSIDRYLVTVRANYSSISGVRRILSEMDRISMDVGGFILTDVPVKHKTYYQYYYQSDSKNKA
ncbi:MAG: polysaccharide biosynthesis tyrosine autokinase, partial [Eubacteriales bacterium]